MRKLTSEHIKEKEESLCLACVTHWSVVSRRFCVVTWIVLKIKYILYSFPSLSSETREPNLHAVQMNRILAIFLNQLYTIIKDVQAVLQTMGRKLARGI